MIDTRKFDTLLAEGLLLRGAWVGTAADGREMLCALAALSPDVAREQSPTACPADVMPAWLAYLTPWLNDAPSDAAWPGLMQRFSALLKRAHVLDAAGWQRADYACRAVSVREAMRHTSDAEVLAACSAVIGLCDRAAAGDMPGADEWSAARKRATAAEVTAEVTAAEARAAATAAEVTAEVTEAEAAEAAEAAAAAAAAWAAATAEAAAAAAAEAARAAATAEAADRISTAVLDAIEAEIVNAEADRATSQS